jgi:hypothetical protein
LLPIGAVMTAAVVSIGYLITLGDPTLRPANAEAGRSSIPTSAGGAAQGAAAGAGARSVAFADFAFPHNAPSAPTTDDVQSKVWQFDGRWWAALVEPQSREVRIFGLDWKTQTWSDTGVLIDPRPDTHADALVAGNHLYVVSGGSAPTGRPMLMRFSYGRSGWSLDPDFPVAVAPSGVGSITVARDSTGRLWVAFVQNDEVTVNWSQGDDHRWGRPTPLPGDDSKVDHDDVAAIVSYGPGSIGVMWSNEELDGVYFGTHRDTDPPDKWTSETVIAGAGVADNHVHVVTAAVGSQRRVLAVLKTSLNDNQTSGLSMPLIVVAAQRAGGGWDVATFGRIVDKHTRPIIAVDQKAQRVIVVATSEAPDARGVYFKTSPLDHLEFADGRGQPLFAGDDDSAANATSAKEVGGDGGLVVVGWEKTHRRYVHAVITDGGPLPARPSGASSRLSPPAGASLIVDDTFEPFPLGSAPTTGWRLTSSATGRLRVVPGDGGRVMQLASRTSLAGRVCRELGSLGTGRFLIDTRVRLDGRGAAYASIPSVRSGSRNAVTVAFGTTGRFMYYSGPSKITTGIAYRVGAWYRSLVLADVSRRTFSWQVRDAADRVVLQVNGVRWRDARARVIDSLCLNTSSGGPGLGLSFDEVRITR